MTETAIAAGKASLDTLVRNLSIPQMEQIADKANQTKDTELRKAGLRMNHRLTPGDVRHIMHAAEHIANVLSVLEHIS